MVGAQAGGIRGLPAPGRDVPDRAVSPGLRRLAGASPARAAKDYLRILELAAKESEAGVDAILGRLLDGDVPITPTVVAEQLGHDLGLPHAMEVVVTTVDLSLYDTLLETGEDLSLTSQSMCMSL